MEISGLDELNLTVAFNDVDLCLKARAHGYRVIWTPNARLLHLESASRGTDTSGENKERLVREASYLRKKWGDLLETGDPFHNPNVLFDPRILAIPRKEKPWQALFSGGGLRVLIERIRGLGTAIVPPQPRSRD